MCWNRVPKLLLPLALLAALTAVGGADDAKPNDPRPNDDKCSIPLPALQSRGVLCGDHFFAIASGRLVQVDLKQQIVKTFDEPVAPLMPYLDVADGKACVASQGHIHVIDLASGTILHSAEYQGRIRGLGFVSETRVFVIGVEELAVVSVRTGDTRWTLPIPGQDESTWGAKRRRGGLTAVQKVGKVLYMADADGQVLKAIDLDDGKLLDDVPTPYWWTSAVQVVGDRAFVRGITLGYGINMPQFGCIDLKTKKYTDLKGGANAADNVARNAFSQLTLVAGPDSGVCLSWAGKVYQYDAQGRQVGETPLAKDDDSRLVGVWNGQALTAGKDSLRLTPLSKATVKGE